MVEQPIAPAPRKNNSNPVTGADVPPPKCDGPVEHEPINRNRHLETNYYAREPMQRLHPMVIALLFRRVLARASDRSPCRRMPLTRPLFQATIKALVSNAIWQIITPGYKVRPVTVSDGNRSP